MASSIIRINLYVFLYSLIANFAHPVTPAFIQMLGLHDYMFGLAFGMMSLANFLFSPFWGKMSGRIGPGKVIAFSSVGYGLMQFMFGSSTQEWQICVARFVAGIFISAISVAEMLYVMQHSGNPGKDLALMTMNNTVVSQFGFLLGGFIGDYSIKITFVIQSVLLIALGVFAYFVLKDWEVRKTPFAVRDINPFADLLESRHLLNPYSASFLLITAMSTLGATCYEQCFNYYLRDVFGFPTSYNGIVKAVIGFACLMLNYFVALRIIRRQRADFSIIWIFAFMVILLLGVVRIELMVPFLAVNILFFGVKSIIVTVLHNMIVDHGAEQSSGMAGLYNSLNMLGSVAGSFIAGFVYGFGPKTSFVLSAIAVFVCLVLSIVHWNIGKKLKRKETQNELQRL